MPCPLLPYCQLCRCRRRRRCHRRCACSPTGLSAHRQSSRTNAQCAGETSWPRVTYPIPWRTPCGGFTSWTAIRWVRLDCLPAFATKYSCTLIFGIFRLCCRQLRASVGPRTRWTVVAREGSSQPPAGPGLECSAAVGRSHLCVSKTDRRRLLLAESRLSTAVVPDSWTCVVSSVCGTPMVPFVFRRQNLENVVACARARKGSTL